MPSHRYYGGGRFDATDDDSYPYLYAGQSVDVAVAETLLRDLPPDDTGIRQLPHARIVGRQISAVCTTADLDLASLRTVADLGAVAQETWLTWCIPATTPNHGTGPTGSDTMRPPPPATSG